MSGRSHVLCDYLSGLYQNIVELSNEYNNNNNNNNNNNGGTIDDEWNDGEWQFLGQCCRLRQNHISRRGILVLIY